MSLTANYFELFGLPIGFDVDMALLADRYRTLQRQVHPDNYANAPERERRLALQTAAHVNTAFQTLKNPLHRGRYLLQLQGIDTDDATDTKLDNAFLMTQMELREELADISQATQSLSALQAFLTRVAQETEQQHTLMRQQFAAQDYAAARNSVRQLQFFYKLHEEAMYLEEALI